MASRPQHRAGGASDPSMHVPPLLRCPWHGAPLTPAGAARGAAAGIGPETDAVDGACGCRFPVAGGIPRFVDSANYAAGFGLQWKAFSRTQLDSHTGTRISRDRLERCLGGSLDIVRGRDVLEAGCGAGRFTELLLGAGARVFAADLSTAVEANYENCARADAYFVCQADLRALPVARRSFDVVLCLGVVQHTPDPEETLAALAGYVKPGGLLVVDHYSPEYLQTPPRRALRSLLLRLPASRAKRLALGLARALLPVHRAVWRDARGMYRMRRYLRRISPLVDYFDDYPELGPELLGQWAVLDTHDTLTDRYKHLRSVAQIREALVSLGLADVHVATGGNGVEARARRPLAPAPAGRAEA